MRSMTETRIDVLLHPDSVLDVRTATDLARRALDARGVAGDVAVTDDVSTATGDAVVVPAPGGAVDLGGDDRCVVRVDFGLAEPDRAPNLFAHIRGRGLDGLRYAVDRVFHHRLHPAEVVRYGEHWEQRVELRRCGRAGAPAAALVHGGYWREAFELDSLDAIAIELLAHCFDTWNIEYRRPAAHGWSTTTADVEAAMGVVDADTVVALGHSAGGQLALRWAADHRPAAVVSLAGVLDLAVARTRLLGNSAAEVIDEADGAASPRARLPLGVPTVVACATEDDPNLNDIGREYVDAARDAGDEVDHVEGPGGHFAVVDPSSEVWADVVRSVQDRLR